MSNRANVQTWLFSAYTACLIIMNILASKQIDVFMFTVTTGILTSPFVFIIQDICAEIFGFKVSKKMIIDGYIVSFIGILLVQLAIQLPSSKYWFNQEEFYTTLISTLRITVSSFCAYMIGSLTNSKIMTSLKETHPKSLFVRAVGSTLVGQLLDNGLFAFLAFLGVLPVNAILTMIAGGTIIEVMCEVILFPVMKRTIPVIEKYINE